MSDLNEDLLDYEPNSSRASTVELDIVNKQLDFTMMSGLPTPSFQDNGGKDTTMEDVGRISMSEAEKLVAEAYCDSANAQRKFKEVIQMVAPGMRVPQTPMPLSRLVPPPVAGSTPRLPIRTLARPLVPYPTGIQRTPGAAPPGVICRTPVIVSAMGRPLGNTAGTVIATNSSVPTMTTSTSQLATNTRTDVVMMKTDEYEKMKMEAEKYKEMMLKKDVRSRLGWKVEGTTSEEWRILGDLCGRCGQDHAGGNCPWRFEDLWCQYPPCTQKMGHTVKVCHEMMKRCRLQVCNNQRGHRKECHFTPEGRHPYGAGRAGAEQLRKDFEKYRHVLLPQEIEVIEKYEEEELRGGRKRRWDNPNPY